VNVDVVLDHTALKSYTQMDSMVVGELIQSVAESGGAVGIPAPVWATIYAAAADEERARLVLLLAADSYTVILPMLIGDLAEVGALTKNLPLHLAHTVSQAQVYGAVLATFDPKQVGGIMHADDIVDLSQPDPDDNSYWAN
jgi:hypothetical protein